MVYGQWCMKFSNVSIVLVLDFVLNKTRAHCAGPLDLSHLLHTPLSRQLKHVGNPLSAPQREERLCD
jgi:hypothetical protein